MYLPIKAMHLISLVSWFAGLFYIFRLYVYHRQHSTNESVTSVLHVMERRLLKAIIIPASLLTLGTGLTLVWIRSDVLSETWFWGKMTLVLFLFAYQGLAWRTCFRFRDGRYDLSEKACRIINELPTIVLIGAVFFVVLKP